MHISVYQIGLAIISVVVIINRTMRLLREGQSQSILKFFTIVIIWGMIGVVALFPSVAHFIRIRFGFGENFNTMIFIAFVVLFVLFFRILSVIENIEFQLTEIVRKESLKKIHKPNYKKKR